MRREAAGHNTRVFSTCVGFLTCARLLFACGGRYESKSEGTGGALGRNRVGDSATPRGQSGSSVMGAETGGAVGLGGAGVAGSCGNGAGAMGTKVACSSCGASIGTVCRVDEFCGYGAVGACRGATASGACKKRPTLCPTQPPSGAPESTVVCGCNGSTYASACAANAAGTDIAFGGTCLER